MKVLITGSTGFVGRNVKEYLLQNTNYEILFPTSKELDCLCEKDVKEYLQKYKFDIVLHFAVYGDGIDKSKDGSKLVEYNLRMFLNFAKYSRFYGKMIYTGSGAEYDKRFPIRKIKEENIGQTIPTDPYGVMKYTVGQLIEQSNNIYNLRLFGIFGPYEYWKTKFISNICCKAIKGLPLSIRQDCEFDYIWIEDFCRLLLSFIQLDIPKYHTYNAVSGTTVKLSELANIVNQITGNSYPVYICKKGMANEYTASNERIMNEIGEFKYTDIRQSTKRLYDYYKQHEDEIDLYSLIYG